VRIPLLTSWPPALHRRDNQGRDVSQAYQKQCLDSWDACGFQVLSVNSRAEIANGLQVPLGVETIQVGADAQARLGRPLPLIADMIRLGAERNPGGTFALTNADIVLAPDFDLSGLARGLRPGTALVAHRVDVDGPEQRHGRLYGPGFDFLLVHAADAANVPDFGLAVGAPWWDHYLPTLLALAGVDVRVVSDRFAYHLAHEDRWRFDWWLDLGESYARQLRDRIRTVPSAAGATQLEQAIIAATGTASLRTQLGRIARAFTEKGRRRAMERQLLGLSDRVIAYLDRCCTASVRQIESR
jgi:hypothetical protein